MDGNPPVDEPILLEALFSYLQQEGVHNFADMVHCYWKPEANMYGVRAGGYPRKRLCELLDRMSGGAFSAAGQELEFSPNTALRLVREIPN